jgi:hypothetical protein
MTRPFDYARTTPETREGFPAASDPLNGFWQGYPCNEVAFDVRLTR